MTKVFIHGSHGTTGLRLKERLCGRSDISLITLDEALRRDDDAIGCAITAADIVFLCLPDDAAREAAALCEARGKRVIDCSTAHRVNPDWVYGMPELGAAQREAIISASRVSVPGCYACGFIALAKPLVAASILSADSQIAFHALSGYSGAGKACIAEYESATRNTELDSPRHYSLSLSHKHLPEMALYSGLAKEPIFTPIICDYPQGMVVALPLFADISLDIYRSFYASQPLINICDGNRSDFLSSNMLAGRDDMEILVSGGQGKAVALARFDNLGKGASGAAIQCMNLMIGEEETKGLIL